MKPDDLLALARSLQTDDYALMSAKNHDYAGDADALANLRAFGFYGVVVRLSDKFARLQNFAKRRERGGDDLLKVKDESIRDTLRDIRVYGILAEAMLNEEEEQ